jgi:hypothetical protein
MGAPSPILCNLWGDGELEGLDRPVAFLSVLRIGAIRISDGTGEIEIRHGAFDQAPTDLVPTYESEKWFQVMTGTELFAGNRTVLA